MRTPAPTPSTSSSTSSSTTSLTTTPTSGASRRGIHRTLALAGSAVLFGGVALAAAAPAQAAGAVLDPVQVERSCKTPGKSGNPEKAYYSSVVLRGSATGSSTFTFDSLSVQNNPALTQITPKTVDVPAGTTTTVTIQVTGAKNSANGPAVLASTVNQGGTISQHTGTIASFAPMQTADCGVSYPSNVNKPWPITTAGVVSADLTGKLLPVPAAAQGATTFVAAGHNDVQYAMKTDGTVVGWDHAGQTVSLPSDWKNLRSIDGHIEPITGAAYTLAVTSDGTVVGTGDGGGHAKTDLLGETGMKTISTAQDSTVGLTEEGGVVAAGWSDGYWMTVPEGYGLDHDVKQVIATYEGAIALKGDGTVVEWNMFDGVVPTPTDVKNITAIASVSSHHGYIALRNDGSVIYWDDNVYGVSKTLTTGATRVAIAEPDMWGYYSVVFVQKQDGTVTAINTATGATTDVPAMKGATQLQGGGNAVVAAVPGS